MRYSVFFPVLLSLVLFSLLLHLGACQGSKRAQSDDASAAEATTVAEADPEVAALQRDTWSLQAYGSPGRPAQVLGRTRLTARFDPAAGQLRGDAGCNTFSAPYRVKGDSLHIQPAAATRKLCEQPAGVMQQETLYLSLLETVRTFRVENQYEPTLYLECQDGQVLIFGRD